MAARQFHVDTPEKLRELSTLVSDGTSIAANMARVWTVTRRRQGGHAWDEQIYAAFSGDRARIAEIVRMDNHAPLINCGKLRYNLALRWCEKNLRQVYNEQ